jgi:two-component system osmolarity sensor histidine kinase EnvZ
VAAEKMKVDISDMEQLISDILWFASHDSKNQEKKSLDLATVLVDICDEYEDSNVPVSFVATSIRPVVWGNLLSLKRVFTNLIENALKYSGQKAVVVRLSLVDGVVVTDIDDLGPGIKQEQLDLMVKPFQRGINPKEVAGTGLGLTIVNEVVHEHLGTMQFENLDPVGFRVTVSLPLYLSA